MLAASAAIRAISSFSTRRPGSPPRRSRRRGPLTAATGGRLIVQSTPGAPVGPFYELAENVPDHWAFLKVRSDAVPTISPAFLERERRQMAPELYAQEYEAEFVMTLGSGALFSMDQIADLILPKARA
jgi:hypothetical protein